MPVTINGTTGIAGPDGSASTPAVQGTDSNTGLFYPAADTVALSTGGSERMRIDSAGNVGIGTSSPSYLLHAAGTNPRINVSASSTGYAGYRASNTSGTFQVAIDDSTGSNYLGTAYGRVIYSDGAYPLQFATNATERMRIDSSGNVLVGKTSLSDSTAGIQLRTQGVYVVGCTSSGSEALMLNRNTSDGTIASIKRGNTEVGTISVTGSATAYNTASPSTDGAQLNYQGITFRATQSASSDANTLDDYEEGTWTPTLTGASSDPTVTYTTQTGQYTKVGRVVHVQCSIVPATYSGGSGVLRIAGLPFTSGSSTFYVTGSAYLDGVDIGASRTWATSYVAPGVSHIRLITSQNNGAASDVLVGGVSAGDNIIIGITYMV